MFCIVQQGVSRKHAEFLLVSLLAHIRGRKKQVLCLIGFVALHDHQRVSWIMFSSFLIGAFSVLLALRDLVDGHVMV